MEDNIFDAENQQMPEAWRDNTKAEDESFELETINKMFLELSQFATAKTKRELELESKLQALKEEVKNLKPASYENGIKLLNEADVLNLITNLEDNG